MNNDVTASIGARITDFTRKMKQVTTSIRKIPNRVTTKINADVDSFNNKMDGLANKIRVFGTIAGGVIRGNLLTLLPAAIPIIASVTGAIGGMSAAFVAAGTGTVAFAALATSALNDVFAANKKIKDLRKELANTKDLEKRAEILKQIEQAQAGLTSEQQRGLTALQKFSSFWGKFAAQFEKPIMDIFIRSLGQLQGLIERLKPAFSGAVEAFDGLSESMGKAFKADDMQRFFDFINTNAGPAITTLGTVFGNIMRGIMNLMTAFGTSSLDMQGGLVKLTEKFAKWTAGLSKSEAFKNFINYVKENGPKMIALIGNITTFLINLGKGMAPLGSFILDVVNGFLQWSNSMMQAHPWVAKVMGVITSLIGVMLSLTPVIIALKVAFGGMASFIWARTAMMRAKLVLGVKMMIQSLGQFIAKMAATVARLAAQAATFIAKWALMGAKAMLHAAKMAGAWVLATGKAMAKAVASMAVASAKFIAKWALMGAKSLLHAAKVAAAFVVAMGPVGWVIATVVALVALIIANWDKVKKWTKAAWSATVDFVKSAWSSIKSFISDALGFIVQWVKVKFLQAKIAINTAMNAAKSTIQNVWSSIKKFTSDALGFIVQWVKVKFQQAKMAIHNAMNSAKSFIQNVWNNIKSYITEKATAIWQAVKQKFQALKDAISEKMNSAWTAIKNIWGNVMDFFRGIDLTSIGRDMIQGLINGIKNMAGNLVSAAKGVVDGAINGAKSLLGIKSPSRVFKQIGIYTGQGMVDGMKKMGGKVAQQAKYMARAAVPQMPDISGQMQSSIRSATHQVKANVKGLSNISVNGGSASGHVYIDKVVVQADDFYKAGDAVKTLEGLKQAYTAN